MSNPQPKKRYAYKCKCGKDPMRGTIQTSPDAERQVFDVLDMAWAMSHNRPGCTLAGKIIEPVLTAAQANKAIAEWARGGRS